MPRIYLSGPMTGIDQLNFPAFDKARDICLACGYEVVSPADLERNRPRYSYEECLRDDFKHLLECDQILMLEGWKDSLGARAEYAIARILGFIVYYEGDLHVPRR
jgi:nucleoside 2-deoxyribosyltransferase